LAQPQACADRNDFLKQLWTRHSEAPTALGLTATGQVLEVLTSKTGSWSIMVTSPAGTTCMVAVGEAWSAVPKAKTDPWDLQS
jgi:hypothetical protein